MERRGGREGEGEEAGGRGREKGEGGRKESESDGEEGGREGEGTDRVWRYTESCLHSTKHPLTFPRHTKSIWEQQIRVQISVLG